VSIIDLELLDGSHTSDTRSCNLDNVCRICPTQLIRIFRLSNLEVRTGSRELNLCAGSSLKVIQMLATSPNKCSMLYDRDLDPQNNAVTQGSYSLFELGLELVDNLGLTTKAHFIGRFALSWTGKCCSAGFFLTVV
jgi:hypothetical protein